MWVKKITLKELSVLYPDKSKTAPKALDLFCGAGGASEGLRMAGFEPTGVDILFQPAYPFRFINGDVTKGLWIPEQFDFIWASPPCQAFTAYKRRKAHVKPMANLIPTIREMLRNSGTPYVIENVPGAPLENPVTLCGSMFGLDVRRHRNFEASFEIRPMDCAHEKQAPRFPPATNRTNLRRTVEVGVWRIPLETQRKAMGIYWMDREELSQAIPPAYSEYIGREFLRSKN